VGVRVREWDLFVGILRGVAHLGRRRRRRRRRSSWVEKRASVDDRDDGEQRGSSRARAAAREVINEDGYNSMTLKRLFPLSGSHRSENSAA